ncbi:MAG: HPt (histidine-containing phosphotransfer) domain-containing protein [Granulosicoccus sp.]|jgi:HPt (histidine-containing phosphotransfer) domain-containing protein
MAFGVRGPDDVTVSIDENALKFIKALQRPGKPDLLERIIDLFTTESPKTLSSMIEGIDSMDMEVVRVAAHTLKSSSAYVGALDLSERCKELERAAHDQNFPACIALGDSVEDIFADSCNALDQLMSKAA